MKTILIAISLSMDAFSLSLAYGTLGNRLINLKLSLIVGLFHFIMPLLGNNLGIVLKFNSKLLVFLILFLIGLQMILESFKEKEITNILKLKSMFLFAFAVSVDSFSVGLGFNYLTNNYLLSCFIFSVFSMTFTYIGLKLGNKINEIIGKTSTILGGILLIIISIKYLF